MYWLVRKSLTTTLQNELETFFVMKIFQTFAGVYSVVPRTP